jgi:hypothetical protein
MIHHRLSAPHKKVHGCVGGRHQVALQALARRRVVVGDDL